MTDTRPPSHDRAIKRGTEGTDNPEILPATHGHFSTPFFRRCRTALELAPGIVEHVVSLNVASGGHSEDSIQASRDIPLPFNEQAWDDGNEMYRRLVYWANAFAVPLSSSAPGPAKRAWRNSRGLVVGFPADITAQQARYVTGIISKWLTIHLELIMHLDPEDVTLFANDLGDVYRINARWPQRDRSTWSRLPCPYCKGRLAIFPPDPGSDERRIVCETCENRVSEDEYEILVAEMATSTKVAQALAKKYTTRAQLMDERREEPPTPADLRSRA